MPVESSVVQGILNYLNSLQRSTAEKVQGTSLSSGKADINACVRGYCVRIEVKTLDHGNKASKKQRINLRRWAAAGAICVVAYTVEDVKAVITDRSVAFNYHKDYGNGMIAERVK